LRTNRHTDTSTDNKGRLKLSSARASSLQLITSTMLHRGRRVSTWTRECADEATNRAEYTDKQFASTADNSRQSAAAVAWCIHSDSRSSTGTYRSATTTTQTDRDIREGKGHPYCARLSWYR